MHGLLQLQIGCLIIQFNHISCHHRLIYQLRLIQLASLGSINQSIVAYYPTGHARTSRLDRRNGEKQRALIDATDQINSEELLTYGAVSVYSWHICQATSIYCYI